MSTISTHVLDTSLGKPAEGIRVTLQRDATLLGSGVTDQDGRVRDLLAAGSSLSPGDYRLTFSVADYFGAKRQSFYNEIVIHFVVASDDEHYHVPLLLSPFGYATYRGS